MPYHQPSPSPQGRLNPPHLPTTSSRTSFQRIWLPVSCSSVTVIRLWMPCQAPGERTRVRESGGHVGQARGHAWAGAGRAWHLVEQEGPHARHAATVVHHCRDVTGERKMCEAGVCPPHRPRHSHRPRSGRGTGKSPTSAGEMGGCPWRPESAGQGTHHVPPPPPPWPLGTPAPQQGHTERGDALAIGLQLTDLKVDQQVVFAVAWPRAGPCQRAELGGGH